MVEQQYADYGLTHVVPFDAPTVEIMIRHLLIAPFGVVLVNEENGTITGGIAGPTVPCTHNAQYFVAQEYGAYGDNLDLLRMAFDEWAASKGAQLVVLSCLEPHNGLRFRKLRKRV